MSAAEGNEVADTLHDRVAEVVWGVLVAARDDPATDLSVVAHAAARNLAEAGLLTTQPQPTAVVLEEFVCGAGYHQAGCACTGPIRESSRSGSRLPHI